MRLVFLEKLDLKLTELNQQLEEAQEVESELQSAFDQANSKFRQDLVSQLQLYCTA